MAGRTRREALEADPESYEFRNEQLEWSEWCEAIVPINVAGAEDSTHTRRTPY